MEDECEYGLPSGTCSTARRLEVVAVAGLLWICFVVFFFSVWWDFVFFFKQKTAYEILSGLVGSEMCIRDRLRSTSKATNLK